MRALLDRHGQSYADELGLDLHKGTPKALFGLLLFAVLSSARDPKQAKKLLTELKGLGPVGADIFLREVQLCWPEYRPYVDKQHAGQAAFLRGVLERVRT